MSGLYESGYRPIGTRKGWEATSLSCSGQGQAGEVMRRYGVPETFGDPTEAVGWFAGDDPALRQMVADYANGRRVELRVNANGSWLAIFTPEPRP